MKFLLAALLNLLLLCTAQAQMPYRTAVTDSLETGKPLLVYIGATWCGPCQQMKFRTFPALKALPGINFTAIDLDRDRKLADQIASPMVPSLTIYKQVDGVWTRRTIYGFRTPNQVRTFLQAL